MSRSKRIRLIFFELRRALGERVGTRELLDAAKSLVDLQADNWAHEPTYDLRNGRTSLDQMELDIAMSDGGWRVYSKEREIVSYAGMDDRFEARRYWTANDIAEELEPWHV